MEKSYYENEYGAIIPICQKCGKSSAFFPKTHPDRDSGGCECTNPKITKAAKKVAGIEF